MTNLSNTVHSRVREFVWWRALLATPIFVCFSLSISTISAATIDDCLDVVPVVLFSANFENNIGNNNWTYLGGASDGNWVHGLPSPYTTGGFLMETTAFQGNYDLLTGNGFGQDLDGGPTIARSGSVAIPVGTTTISFQYYFAYFQNSSNSDYLRIELRRASNNNLLQTLVSETGANTSKPASWVGFTANISSLVGETIYIQVVAADLGGGSKVEAAIDMVEIINEPPPSLAGAVYHDLNSNGVKETSELPLSGIKVNIYDSVGVFLDSVNTNAAGNYSFLGLSNSGNYTIVFENFPVGYLPSNLGPNNGGPVQHILGNQNASLGLYKIDGFCEEDPFLILPCFVEGPLNGPYANDAAIIKFRASSDGHDFVGTNKTANFKASMIANYNQVGTVNGLAFQKTTKKYYAASFFKRYTTFGPNGPDAIYQLDLNGGVTGVIELDQLLGTINSAGGDAHTFTPINGHVYDLGTNDVGFNAVGRRSFGDIEMSGDNNTLYAINLFDRKIYAFNVSSGITANTTIINSWFAPDATTSGRHRPFGLAWEQGKLWVGSVDQNGQNAFVHSLNVQTGVFTLVLTIPLNYQRQAFFGSANNGTANNNWNAWRTNTSFSPYSISNEIAYPQPILSDIEFTVDGSMILGFRDRFGDQAGAGKYFSLSSNNLTWAIAQGDILKACKVGNSFVLETGQSGACPSSGGLDNSGPGGYEFYEWDIFSLEQNSWNPNSTGGAFHWETTQGGLIQLDNLPYVITTAMDPFDDFSGGVIKLNNATGERANIPNQPVNVGNMGGGYTVFDGGDFNGNLPASNGLASKANGLGDLEAACYLPIMIGNYVWYDVDKDGRQDANEPALSGVIVQLFKDTMLVGIDTTDTNGNYFFGGVQLSNILPGKDLSANTSYILSIKYNQTLSTTYNLGGSTIANNTNDQLDSDAEVSPDLTAAIINFTTGFAGYTNYSLDFGFIPCHVVESEIVYSGCEYDGYSITVGGTVYNEGNPTGSETFQATNGCDSIVDINLTFSPSHVIRYNYTGCSGDGYSITVNGQSYNESNPRDTINLNTMTGCDSIFYIDLVYNPKASVEAGMSSTPICSNGNLDLATLGASISGGITTGVWTTTGDGMFNNNGKFGGVNSATTYLPGPFEIATGDIILNLTSDDPLGPCEPQADAIMILINDLLCSQFPWVGK